MPHTQTQNNYRNNNNTSPFRPAEKARFRVPTWDPPTFYHVAEMAINIWKGHVIN